MEQPSKKVLLICGSRTVNDALTVKESIRSYLLKKSPEKYRVIHGACSGVDELAGIVAKELGFNVTEYPANWDKYGKAAGPRRNSKMVKIATKVLALPGPNSRGTHDTIKKAKDANIPVLILKTTSVS